MMQVKKYRAATTREALEQIKQDLGQDALVPLPARPAHPLL
jgi:flagellar biosynthesis GTPase FlhF